MFCQYCGEKKLHQATDKLNCLLRHIAPKIGVAIEALEALVPEDADRAALHDRIVTVAWRFLIDHKLLDFPKPTLEQWRPMAAELKRQLAVAIKQGV